MYLFTTQLFKDGYYSGLEDQDVLDITVKGNHPIGNAFAPTWKIVLAHQKGEITDAEYIAVYHTLMEKSYAERQDVWQWVLNQPRVILACYCPPERFCHRTLAAYYLIELGATDMGER